MDFTGPVRRHVSCFDRNMSYIKQGIELIAQVRNKEGLAAAHISVEKFKAYLVELHYFRTRCPDLSPDQKREFDSKMGDFVNRYRLLLSAIERIN